MTVRSLYTMYVHVLIMHTQDDVCVLVVPVRVRTTRVVQQVLRLTYLGIVNLDFVTSVCSAASQKQMKLIFQRIFATILKKILLQSLEGGR